jgi:arsenical pump membrane protein
MIATMIAISCICIAIVLCIIFNLHIRIKNYVLNLYWVVAFVGAIVLLAINSVDLQSLLQAFSFSNNSSPFVILVLFFSITMLSLFLDEVGFFEFLAAKLLNKSDGSQYKLFFTLYWSIALLTIFTSNDIIILTFTPLICYFCKRAKINPLPYLFAEFVAANTFSMVFYIGNPTSIWLCTSYNVAFFDYFFVMWLPAILAGLTSLLVLWLLFKKDLKEKMQISSKLLIDNEIKNKFLAIIGVMMLIICIALFIISSYFDLPIWLIALCCATICLLFAINKPKVILRTLSRLPWELVPFLIGMFVVVLASNQQNITSKVFEIMNNSFPILTYGGFSFLFANIINNIPMTMFFTDIISFGQTSLAAIYATSIGSNVCALLTPIGSLAGIMWISILKKQEIEMSFRKFVKYGLIIALPTLFASLFGLWIGLMI